MAMERFALKGKSAVVTGAGRGLGKQMALALAKAGANVVVAARTQAQIDETAREINALGEGQRAVALATDVRDPEQVERLVARCVEEFGRIDIMVNNAGIGDARAALKAVWEISDSDWRDSVDVNLSSSFYGARAAAKRMVEQGGGVIINVSSGTATRGYATDMAYGAAKAGVISLTMSLAVTLARHGIRVHCIIPGFVAQTPAANEEEVQQRKERARFFPVRRLGEAWELGPLAVFLASDASSYLTAQGFVIDGGGLSGGLAPVDFAPVVELS